MTRVSVTDWLNSHCADRLISAVLIGQSPCSGGDTLQANQHHGSPPAPSLYIQRTIHTYVHTTHNTHFHIHNNWKLSRYVIAKYKWDMLACRDSSKRMERYLNVNDDTRITAYLQFQTCNTVLVKRMCLARFTQIGEMTHIIIITVNCSAILWPFAPLWSCVLHQDKSGHSSWLLILPVVWNHDEEL